VAFSHGDSPDRVRVTNWFRPYVPWNCLDQVEAVYVRRMLEQTEMIKTIKEYYFRTGIISVITEGISTHFFHYIATDPFR